MVLLLPPSPEVQEQRLRKRGDDDESVARRIAKGRDEIARGGAIADHTVVNVEVAQALREVRDILESHRKAST